MSFSKLTISISILADAIARELSDDDLDLLSASLTQLGDTLATISIERSRYHNRKEADDRDLAILRDNEKE